MIAAVFGDVHGNLPGMYEMCRNWQGKNKKKIELVLQTGDFGLWKSYEEMDKATRKHYKKDESELASAKYLGGKRLPPIETWFIHGNHDNFPLLRKKEGKAADLIGRIIYLSPGTVREFFKGGESLRVAALGGIEYRFGKYPIPSQERIQKYLHPTSLEKLQNDCPETDVLLLHEAPINKGLRNKFPTGSKRIKELIEKLQPRFVFFGHYDDPPEPFYIGSSLCVGTNFNGAKKVSNRDGAMGILDTKRWKFEYVK